MKTLSLDSIKADIDDLDKKINRLESSLEKSRHERDALLLVLERYSEKPKKALPKDSIEVSIEEVMNLKLEDALIYIARKNGGTLNSTAARGLLEDAGILNGSQNGNSLWNALKSSSHFQKVSRGVYRLVEQTEPAQ